MSSLADQILEDLKTAMRAKDKLALSVLRNLKSAIKYAAIEQGGADAELDEASCLAVLRKEVKKRHDSVESFTKGGRPELAEQELAEIKVLEGYLPAAPSTEDLEALVNETISALGASTRKDMGQVMKVLQEKTGGAVDNKALSQLVAGKLS